MSKQERCPTLAEVVRLLHNKGLCNWDYGTYEEMEKSGAECACYEYARPIFELFGHDSAPSSVAEQPSREQAVRLCKFCDQVNPNWRHNRCPNCGELTDKCEMCGQSLGREQVVEGLVRHLGQALRQWKSYAEEFEGVDLEDDITVEAEMYRNAKSAYEAASRGERQ